MKSRYVLYPSVLELRKKQMSDKVTLEEKMTALIERVDYQQFPDTTVTVCLIWLKNGAKVHGVNYGHINPEEHDWEMGKKEAYKNAFNKIPELENYLLRQKLFENKQKTIEHASMTLINYEYPGAGN